MLKGIICDLDGAYFIGGKEAFIKTIVKKYDLDEAIVRTVFLSSDEMMDYKRGKLSDEEYWKIFISKFNIKATQDELISILTEGYKQDEKVAHLIRSLKSSGVKTIICSNNFPARVKALDNKFNFLQDFDVKVFSYDVGSLKLDDFKMFEEVVNSSKLLKEDICMFDNGVENVRHAKEFGFQAILFEDYLQLIEKLEEYGLKI